MKKRGLSKIVAVLFIILISIVAIGLVWSFLSNLITKQATEVEKQQEFLNCIEDVDVIITNACYEDNLFKITLKNKRELILGDFFLVTYNYLNKTSEVIPTPYHTYIGPYKTETIILPYKPEIEKIKVIPKIETQSYMCPASAPEYEGIGECEDEN